MILSDMESLLDGEEEMAEPATDCLGAEAMVRRIASLCYVPVACRSQKHQAAAQDARKNLSRRTNKNLIGYEVQTSASSKPFGLSLSKPPKS